MPPWKNKIKNHIYYSPPPISSNAGNRVHPVKKLKVTNRQSVIKYDITNCTQFTMMNRKKIFTDDLLAVKIYSYRRLYLTTTLKKHKTCIQYCNKSSNIRIFD